MVKKRCVYRSTVKTLMESTLNRVKSTLPEDNKHQPEDVVVNDVTEGSGGSVHFGVHEPVQEQAQEVQEVEKKEGIDYPSNLSPKFYAQFEKLSVSARTAACRIMEYMISMCPVKSNLDPGKAAAKHRTLFMSLSVLSNVNENEFRDNMAFILPVIAADMKEKGYNSVFFPVNYNRYLEMADGSTNDAKAMPFMFQLFTMIADPVQRATFIKENKPDEIQIAIAHASGSRGLTEQGRVNLTRFLTK